MLIVIGWDPLLYEGLLTRAKRAPVPLSVQETSLGGLHYKTQVIERHVNATLQGTQQSKSLGQGQKATGPFFNS